MKRIVRPALVLLILGATGWGMARSIIGQREIRPKVPRLKLTGVSTNLPATASCITPFTTVNAFPDLQFVDPTFLVPFPDSSECFLVLERHGRIQKVSASPGNCEKKPFLDITDRVIDTRYTGEDGLSGIALHPEFAKPDSPHRGEFFLHYTTHGNGQRAIRLSKFRLPQGSDVADPNSEVVLIEQPDENISHNGGTVLFGPDGFLYFTIGDDDVRHPNKHAQHIDRDLFSGVLRIDVDCRGGEVSHPPPRQPNTGKTAHYYIPNDNPWVGVPSALEEFYAIGLRNPWRASFDRESGKLWVSDVGERRREEVSIVESGSNCGWSYLEGSVWSNSHSPQALGRPEPYLGKETAPIYEYEREAMNRCIIGGYVYRGKQIPELVGKYVFADMSGRISAITIDENDKFLAKELLAVEVDGRIVSLAEDADGELFLCVIKLLSVENSAIRRLVRADVLESQKLPERLSQTGVFKDLAKLKPAAGFVPFEVNSPLWSDRAEKYRWIGLPAKQKIRGPMQGPWEFPIGTVFVKHFELPLDESRSQESGVRSQESPVSGRANGPQSAANTRRLETRVLVRDAKGGYYAATYRWNDEETDARLVEHSETEEIEYIDADGQKQTQTWLYPGRFECMVCHNPQANFVLGFSAKQLNREITIKGKIQNQLLRFAKAGMLEKKLREDRLDSLLQLVALDDPHATLEHRVRSYLDSNCAHCHRPELYLSVFDGRFERPLDKQYIIDEVAIMHVFADKQAKGVMPGNLTHSYLYQRMKSNEPNMRMPPLARNVVHEEAVKLMEEWITSMPTAPEAVAQNIDGKTTN